MLYLLKVFFFGFIFCLVKFKNHLNFSRFYLFNLVLNVASILPQPLIGFGEFSIESQLLKIFWMSLILIEISFELFLLKKIE